MEVLATVALLSLILAMAAEALMLVTRTVGQNATRMDQTMQAKTAIESMTRTLRTAIMPTQLNATCTGCDIGAFISGDSTYVQFYANIDNNIAGTGTDPNQNGPRKVRYSMDAAGVLTETVQKPNVHAWNDYNFVYCTPGTTGCVVTSRIIARNVVPGSQLFTYYDKLGAALAVPLQAATSRLSSVDSIDIALTVRVNGVVGGSTVNTRVTLPNADSVIAPTPTTT